jgi:erythrocyte band 7 integral membrane protein
VIAAEGEKKASGALRDASEIISESSSALQLRYLQVLLTQAVSILLVRGFNPKGN